jgi:hypothetical protein
VLRRFFLETGVSSLRHTPLESHAYDTPPGQPSFQHPHRVGGPQPLIRRGRTVLPTVNKVRHSEGSSRQNAHVSGARISALSYVETERAVSASLRFFARSQQVGGIRCFFCICGKTCAAYQPHVRPLHQSAPCYFTPLKHSDASTSAISLSHLVRAD